MTPCRRCRKRPQRRWQATQDAISLNSKLFARIQTLYDARASLKLDPEQASCSNFYYQEVRAGRR